MNEKVGTRKINRFITKGNERKDEVMFNIPFGKKHTYRYVFHIISIVCDISYCRWSLKKKNSSRLRKRMRIEEKGR